jgi:hypothetical protein
VLDNIHRVSRSIDLQRAIVSPFDAILSVKPEIADTVLSSGSSLTISGRSGIV